METNTQVRVKSWPTGAPLATDFEVVETPMPRPAEGQVLVRSLFLSLDPYYRHVLGPRFMGRALCGPGDLMFGTILGEVIESRTSAMVVGDFVVFDAGWQAFAVGEPYLMRRLDPSIFGKHGVPLETALSVLGLPGLTAFIAINEMARLKLGDTFVVSSAAGGVGGMAGQLAKRLGARAVGIAGGPEKCALVTNTLGFDACVDYHADQWIEALAEATPNGIDVDLENHGGKVHAAVLPRMNVHGRIIMCGLVEQYNDNAIPPPGPSWGAIIGKRLTVQGITVADWLHRYTALETRIAPMIREGSLIWKEDITQGLASAPAAFEKLMAGRNVGKSLVRLG